MTATIFKSAKKHLESYKKRFPDRTASQAEEIAKNWAINYYRETMGKEPDSRWLKGLTKELNK